MRSIVVGTRPVSGGLSTKFRQYWYENALRPLSRLPLSRNDLTDNSDSAGMLFRSLAGQLLLKVAPKC